MALLLDMGAQQVMWWVTPPPPPPPPRLNSLPRFTIFVKFRAGCTENVCFNIQQNETVFNSFILLIIVCFYINLHCNVCVCTCGCACISCNLAHVGMQHNNMKHTKYGLLRSKRKLPLLVLMHMNCVCLYWSKFSKVLQMQHWGLFNMLVCVVHVNSKVHTCTCVCLCI